jgi:methionine synthase II (cobalamin-independent)
MGDYAKIDLFFGGDYLCTTTQSKTCREAKAKILERLNYYQGKNTIYLGLVDQQIRKYPHLLKARFQK